MEIGWGSPELLKELHKDLERKYKQHGERVEQIWRSFSKAQREKAFRAGLADGVALKHRNDRSLGHGPYAIFPELNVRDIAGPRADYLLDHLKHRATKSLCEQYCEGVNGESGDREFIYDSLRINRIRPTNNYGKYRLTCFWSEEDYGRTSIIKNPADYDEIMSAMSMAVNAGLFISQSIGELILIRQTYLLQILNTLIEDILDLSSTSRGTKSLPKKPAEAVNAAFPSLSINTKQDKVVPEDILAAAQDQKSSLEVYLDLCRTEPVFLAHVVNLWLFTRPELVQDEKGRFMPPITDKYISIVFFEVINNAVIGAAVWNFLESLVRILLDETIDRASRSIILQEISNVCHFEYDRIQRLFKRYVQTASGSKYFKRISGAYDNGMARVVMKVKPERFTKDDDQLHYILRLCQTETDALQAVTWIRKLDELHQRHPVERDKMEERVSDAYGDLVVTVCFIQSMFKLFPLPPFHAKKGQTYVSRLKALTAELAPLKTEIDLAEFAAPIDNLKEPGMAEKALSTLDQFIVKRTGTRMGFLYRNINDECLADIHLQLQKVKKARSADPVSSPSCKTPLPEAHSPATRIQERRHKDKTRPVQTPVCRVTATLASIADDKAEGKPSVFKVKQATYELF